MEKEEWRAIGLSPLRISESTSVRQRYGRIQARGHGTASIRGPFRPGVSWRRVSVYLVVKFVHILVAIIAVGSSAGSSLWLRLAIRSPSHLPFALRSAKRLDEVVTRPGLIVMALTGLWMAATRWSLSLFWVRASLILVVIVLVLLYVVVGPLLTRLIRVTDSDGLSTPAWKRSNWLFEVFGGAAGLIIVVIVWLMVTKPS